jgi:hypothetical protein
MSRTLSGSVEDTEGGLDVFRFLFTRRKIKNNNLVNYNNKKWNEKYIKSIKNPYNTQDQCRIHKKKCGIFEILY